MKKKQTLGTFISKNIIYIAFVIMLIGLSVFTSSFLQMKNLVNVLRQATVVGVLSMGMTFVIIGGGIDLSVGSTMALASCIAAAYSTSTTAIPLPLAIALGCLVGIVVGALNGIVVAYLGVVPFIATLGMQYAVRGVALFLYWRPPNQCIDDGIYQPPCSGHHLCNRSPDFLVLPCKDAVRSLYLCDRW